MENERIDKYLELSMRTKKRLWNGRVTVIPIVVRHVLRRLRKETGRTRNPRKNQDYPDSTIVEIG